MAHRTQLALIALALLLALSPLAAWPAGLGRLALYSMVGEPLNAEIEIVSVQPTEAGSLAANVAPADVYRQAQIAPLPSPEAVRVGIERRPDGRQFVKVSSTGPVDQPLVNLPVELSWAGGGIVRQYSFLLDSVDHRTTMAAAPAAAAAPTPTAPPPTLQPVRASAPEPAPAAAAPAPEPVLARDARDPQPAPVTAAFAAPAPERIARDARDPLPARQALIALATPPSEYTVEPGDTLAKIAQTTLHEGVTVPQMSVAIFRANEDAFLGGRMNRLKSGRTLKIPDRATAAAIPLEEA